MIDGYFKVNDTQCAYKKWILNEKNVSSVVQQDEQDLVIFPSNSADADSSETLQLHLIGLTYGNRNTTVLLSINLQGGAELLAYRLQSPQFTLRPPKYKIMVVTTSTSLVEYGKIEMYRYIDLPEI